MFFPIIIFNIWKANNFKDRWNNFQPTFCQQSILLLASSGQQDNNKPHQFIQNIHQHTTYCINVVFYYPFWHCNPEHSHNSSRNIGTKINILFCWGMGYFFANIKFCKRCRTIYFIIIFEDQNNLLTL